METYKVVFDEEKDKGVFAISLVESPAMESEFIALSKENKIQLTEVDRKERTLLGVALIPDKPIYRNTDGKEYNIVFDKETIKMAAHNFIKQGYQGNSSIEHENKINGVSIVEAWMVKDPKNDTANAYNLPKDDIVEGAWVVKMKCENDEIYNKALNGEVKGFSIDGLFSLEKINLKQDDKMNKIDKAMNSLKEMFVSLTSEDEAKKVELGKIATADGVMIQYEGETLEAGVSVFVMQDEQQIPLPVGEYELEDGKILVVSEDGLVTEIKEAKAEGAPAEDAPVEMENDTEKFLNDIKSLLVKFSGETEAKLDVFETKLSEAVKENKELNDKIVELSKEPESAPKKSVPTQVINKKLTLAQRLENKLK